MQRFWAIAPFQSDDPETFDKVWQFDLSNNVISMGWDQLGNISDYTHEMLIDAVSAIYPEKPQQTKSLYVNMLWAFYHEIKAGDIIMARRGRKTLAALGKAVGRTFFSSGKNPFAPRHSHFIEVDWLPQPRDKSFSTVVFAMHTLTEFSEEQYRNILGESNTVGTPVSVAETVEDPNAFVLEKYLEDFIVTNFQTIFKGRLQIYRDDEGSDGQQFVTEIGPIDILAVEPKSNSFVVIELKKGRPSDQVVGQILRYMGWVKHNLCRSDQSVKGLVICRDSDPKLTYALTMTRDIDVKYYSISFKLNDSL